MSRNEFSAIASLKMLHRAQEQYQAARDPNLDDNDSVEFGDFGDLIEAGFLSDRFARESATRVRANGYIFEIHLPGDPDDPEGRWHAYAWPESYDWTGKRALFTIRGGCVMSTGNYLKKYSGESNHPAHDAAFMDPEPGDTKPRVAFKGNGYDGQRWFET